MAVIVSSFAQVITAKPGDNLFALASIYLGAADQWNRIAQLNLATLGGVADPFIQPGAFLTLQLPPVKAKGGNGGIFGQ